MEIVRASAATLDEGIMKPIFFAVRRSAIVGAGMVGIMHTVQVVVLGEKKMGMGCDWKKVLPLCSS